MDGWRDQGVSSNQEFTRTRSNTYRKPPLGRNLNWQQSVPSWEKKFIASIGSVPWKKLVETKKFIHLYDNVIKWNDSAGKEAFQNAKNKFYANMHGLPLPSDNYFLDPDIYIDKIDWNYSHVDPNLILDLESDSVGPDSRSNDEQVVIFGTSFPPSYQSFSPYGWGDSDDDEKKKDPDTYQEYNNFPEGNTWGVVDGGDNWRGSNEGDKTGNGDQGGGGGGGDRSDYWGWNVYDNNNNYYGDANNEMRNGSGGGRYKTSRFWRDDNRSRRNNGNGKKSSGSCRVVNPGAGTGGGGVHRWSVKKPVS